MVRLTQQILPFVPHKLENGFMLAVAARPCMLQSYPRFVVKLPRCPSVAPFLLMGHQDMTQDEVLVFKSFQYFKSRFVVEG